MKQMKLPLEIPPGYKLIFRATKTVKGKVLHAKACGKKAWPLLVKDI